MSHPIVSSVVRSRLGRGLLIAVVIAVGLLLAAAATSALAAAAPAAAHPAKRLPRPAADPPAPQLFFDFNTNSQASNPASFAGLGDDVFFTAYTPEYGTEVWHTGGAATGAELLLDIVSGPVSSLAGPLVVYQGALYFAATDGVHGQELWTSDGTALGTHMLGEVFTQTSPAPEISGLVACGDWLYFRACDPAHGCELWQSDGTAAGTHLLVDLEPGSDGSYPSRLTASSLGLYFAAGVGGYIQPWISDGTPAGTVMLADFSSLYDAGKAAEANGRLFFTSHHSNDGDVWVSDGTPAGTTLLTPSLYGVYFVPAGDVMYYSQVGFGAPGSLWQSDGTPAGTRLVLTSTRQVWPRGFAGGRLLFVEATGSPSGPEPYWLGARILRATDGTLTGTTTVMTWTTGRLDYTEQQVIDGVMFFAENDEAGTELWRSDGTPAGTYRLTELDGKTEPEDDYPARLAAMAGSLYFNANDLAHGREPWRSDGTIAGTRLVHDVNTRSEPSWPNFGVNAGRLFIGADDGLAGHQPWVSDGTLSGTHLLMPGADLSVVGGWAPLGSITLFDAFPAGDRELWRTDGTPAGTHHVTTTVSGAGELHVMNGVAYYGAAGTGSNQLWRTDGTTAGSWLVAEIPTGGPYGFIELGQVYHDRLYFAALDPAGRELWASDGTGAGTRRFADLQQGTGSSSPSELTVFNDRLFFVATTSAHGSEAWVSDGTEAGTQVLDLVPGPAWGTRAVGPAAGGQLFLWVSSSEHLGLDLWATDGTLAGTHPVRELENASILSAHEGAIAAGDRIFFRVHDGDGGQLWVSDGTEAGTHLVADAWPGEYSQIDEMLGYYDGYIFFAATDETHGSELWASDGTEAGTVLLADLMPGPTGSDPTSLRCLNDALYFTAEDLAHGRELFVLPGVDCGCHPPSTRNDALTLSEDTSAAADVLFNDTDLDRLEVSVAVPPAHGTVAVNGRMLVYTPAPNYHGPDSLTYLAVDTNGDTSAGTLTIEVLPINDAPLAQADTADGVYGQPVAIAVLANDSDVEGDPLSLVAVGPPAYGSVVAAGAVITYESGVGYVSVDTFTYTVSDGVLTATASVTVRLAPPGDWTFLPLLAQPPDGP